MSSASASSPPAREDVLERLDYVRAKLKASRDANRGSYSKLNVIWQEVIEVLGYVLDLAPKDILRLRMHCGLFTGDMPWQFWHASDQYDAPTFATQLGYRSLIKALPEELWLSEARNPFIPRPMGVNWQGRIINANVARFQSVLTNLHLIGLWSQLADPRRAGEGPAIVMEIGPGYGGLAEFFFSRSQRPIHFVAVDLPEILLFCAGFVAAALPDVDIIAVDTQEDFAKASRDRHTLFLTPSFSSLAARALRRIDLVLNAASFQEMTTQDIEAYLDLIMPRLAGILYSDNIDRHLLNKQSAPISKIFQRYGSMFPLPGVYDDVIAQNKWDWFYSTFMLGGESAIAALQKHIRVYFGPMKTGSVMDYQNRTFTMTGV